MQNARRRFEPTIPLINIVFLMLVFFMVAGTLTMPIDGQVTLVSTAELEGRAPPDALLVHADGQITHSGVQVDSLEGFFAGLSAAEQDAFRLIPDRSLPADRLIGIVARLQGLGAQKVLLVTERDLP